jgi:glycosyltransferase involved in cell wall biosynthesis
LAVLGLKNKPKVIYTLHGFHIARKPFYLKWPLIFMERFLNRLTDVLVCVSEADRRLVLQYGTIAKDRIAVIKNGIDIERFVKNENLIQDIKKQLELHDEFIITSIGRLHPPKDFSTILRALKIILAKIGNVKLLIVGDGPLREFLEKETGKLELNECVKFLGSREDIPELIYLSDIIILSTNWEGLPLVPLEAGACKKPIIASMVEGVGEVVIDGQTGYLFCPGSAKDLADKILKLYYSKELREKMGEAGYQFVTKNFNKEKMLKEYQGLYQSML